MKNKLTDLNDHLFAQLERLSEEDITPEKLAMEIERTNSITSVAKQIISNGCLVLDAQKAIADGCLHSRPVPKMLEGPAE